MHHLLSLHTTLNFSGFTSIYGPNGYIQPHVLPSAIARHHNQYNQIPSHHSAIVPPSQHYLGLHGSSPLASPCTSRNSSSPIVNTKQQIMGHYQSEFNGHRSPANAVSQKCNFIDKPRIDQVINSQNASKTSPHGFSCQNERQSSHIASTFNHDGSTPSTTIQNTTGRSTQIREVEPVDTANQALLTYNNNLTEKSTAMTTPFDVINNAESSNVFSYHSYNQRNQFSHFNGANISPFNSHSHFNTQSGFSNQFLPFAYYQQRQKMELDFSLIGGTSSKEVSSANSSYLLSNADSANTVTTNTTHQSQPPNNHNRFQRLTHL